MNKKIFSILLAMILMVSMLSMPVFADPTEDGNGDGKVNVNDLIRLRKYLAGAEKQIIAGNADVNADEVVDILDLVPDLVVGGNTAPRIIDHQTAGFRGTDSRRCPDK